MLCRISRNWLLAMTTLLTLVCAATLGSVWGQEDADRLGQGLAAFNRGAALLGQYEYQKSAEQTAVAVELFPQWLAARYNLALAHLNMQQSEGAEQYLELARKGFEEILAADPDHLSARFSLGMYYQHLGKNDRAAECFGHVHRADPDDLYAAYKYA